MRPAEMQWLFVVLFLIAALGYYAYRGWNASPPNTIIGKAWVIDGDTIVINNTHIRLEGIDAPESTQSCIDARGGSWACGSRATRELRNYIRGQELTCTEKALDRYRRTLAICKVPDGTDINAWMVRQGLAIAYGFAKTYRSEQNEAENAKRGIWAGTFTEPAQWRKLNPNREAE